MSNSLWHHELKHTRLPYPSLSPRVCSNSCALSQWCNLTILSSLIPFSSCPQSFPHQGCCVCFFFFFAMSQHFPSGGQSIGASALESVIAMNIQDWFPLGLTGLIPLLSKGLSRLFSITTFQSISSSVLSLLYGPTLSSILDYREKKT